MKFLLDANIPYSAKEKTPKNLKVLHVRDVNLETASDDSIISYAKINKLTLITRDLDFANIQNYPLKRHSGIIVIRVPFYFTAHQINKTISEFLKSPYLKQVGRAITIVEPGLVRMRKLDLK